jgi:hypothetical protein
MNKLQEWMDRATPEQKKQLAEAAGTTLGSLRFTAAARRFNGTVSITPEFARRLELAAATIHDAALPTIKREDLCPACAQCEYQQYCNTQKQCNTN